MNDKTPLISTPLFGKDFELFKNIVNQGIDGRLEAFTKSEFRARRDRFEFHFHPEESSLLLRRLCETASEYTEQWIDDIVYTLYGKAL